MKLYKFIRIDVGTVEKMIAGWLRFTPLHELNDPTEMLPVFDEIAIRQSLAELRANGHTDEQFKWLGCQEAVLDRLAPNAKVILRPATKAEADKTIRSRIYDDMAYMRQAHHEAVNFIKAGVGIMSMTERYDSLPMWAHYADNASGAIVEYEGLELAFPGDETGSLNSVKPVRYQKNPTGMTFDPSSQENLFLSKFEDWAYEREHRVILALRDCDNSVHEHLYLKKIDPTHVKRIILGWNCNDQTVRLVADQIKNGSSAVKIAFASLRDGRVVISDTRTKH